MMRNMSREGIKSKTNSTTNDFTNFVDIFDERYYTINKRILCYIGQWPYQSVFERSIRSIFLVTAAVSLIVPQTLQLIQSWRETAVFAECFSPFVTNLGCNIKLLNFAVHSRKVRNTKMFRLENMTKVDNEVSVRLVTNIQENIYYQQIVDCIKKHKRAIEYINITQATCQWYLLLLVGLNMVSISCTCSQIVAKGTGTENLLRFTFFTVAQIFHLFCNSLPGQWIMETSSLLPFSGYSCNWHLMSPRSRKLIVLFIRRSSEPCLISAGKMYVMSMENFCCVLQTSMSYMTLLTSTQ